MPRCACVKLYSPPSLFTFDQSAARTLRNFTIWFEYVVDGVIGGRYTGTRDHYSVHHGGLLTEDLELYQLRI